MKNENKQKSFIYGLKWIFEIRIVKVAFKPIINLYITNIDIPIVFLGKKMTSNQIKEVYLRTSFLMEKNYLYKIVAIIKKIYLGFQNNDYRFQD